MLTRQLMNMPAFLLFNIWSRDKIWTNALAYSKYGGGYAGINYWCKYSKYFEGKPKDIVFTAIHHVSHLGTKIIAVLFSMLLLLSDNMY